jgi:hypothetical protein
MKPARWEVRNAIDELEHVYQLVFSDHPDPADHDDAARRMRRALAILRANERMDPRDPS